MKTATIPTTRRRSARAEVPQALADVALIDGPASAAAACESYSKFLDGVRRTAEGRLRPGEVPWPQPAISGNRFTRYRLADVRRWLEQRAAQGVRDDAVVRRATAAGAAGVAARRARRSALQLGCTK